MKGTICGDKDALLFRKGRKNVIVSLYNEKKVMEPKGLTIDKDGPSRSHPNMNYICMFNKESTTSKS
jgi:hypothetical protein